MFAFRVGVHAFYMLKFDKKVAAIMGPFSCVKLRVSHCERLCFAICSKK